MEISIFGIVPGSDCTFKNNPVPGVQEHLGGAASHLWPIRVLFIALKNKAYITYALSNTADLPGSPTCFVKGCRRNMPCYRRLKFIELARRLTEIVREIIMCNSAFPNYLSRYAIFQKS